MNLLLSVCLLSGLVLSLFGDNQEECYARISEINGDLFDGNGDTDFIEIQVSFFLLTLVAKKIIPNPSTYSTMLYLFYIYLISDNARPN